MGYTNELFQITAKISNHNSPQDEIDERLWKELKDEVEELVNDPKYETIHPMTL